MQSDIDLVWACVDPHIKEGNVAKAIKVYRRTAHVGLLQAQEDVEKRIEFIQSHSTSSYSNRPNFNNNGQAERASLPIEVDILLKQGQMIEAIKMHRTLTGSSLKEAKDAVDSVQNILHPVQHPSFDPIETELKTNASKKNWLLIIALTLLATIIFFIFKK